MSSTLNKKISNPTKTLKTIIIQQRIPPLMNELSLQLPNQTIEETIQHLNIETNSIYIHLYPLYTCLMLHCFQTLKRNIKPYIQLKMGGQA